MIDDLHFFSDVHISKRRKLALLISAAFELAAAVRNDKVIFAFFIGGVFSLSLSATRVLEFLAKRDFTLIEWFIVFQGALFALVLLSYHIGVKVSFRFKSKLRVGFRDSWFFLSSFNVLILSLLPMFKEAPVKGVVFASGAALVVIGIYLLFYERKVAVKKQPDLDIPGVLEADVPVDITGCGAGDMKKVQINGDTRDAFLLAPSEERTLSFPGGTRRVKFAVGIRESSRAELLGEAVLTVSDVSDGPEGAVIYSKCLEARSENFNKAWREVALDLPGTSSAKEVKLRVKIEPDKRVTVRSGDNAYSVTAPRVSGKKSPRKIIFIVMDAVRADHVGCYGYNRATTGNIDRFAEDSVRFDSAFVQGDWTLSAFMSMLTSMYPSAHHVYHDEVYHSLNKDVLTLPAALRKEGFITRGYFTHKRVMSHFGFARGFDSHIFRQCDKRWNIATAEDVTARAIDMMEFHNDDDLFLMLHYFDTHQPCDPPAPYSEMFDKAYGRKIIDNVRRKLSENKSAGFDSKDLVNFIARYDSEIYQVDAKIGTILEHLKRKGHYDDAMVVITADHGMLLGDHGSLTEITLFDETVKVPLIIKFPEHLRAAKGIVVNKDVVEANIDIMPTMLDAYGFAIPATVQGKSMLSDCGLAEDSNFRRRKGFAVSESLFGGTYSVSLREKSGRYTFKTKFDVTNFGNYKEDHVAEQVFRGYDNAAETEMTSEEDRMRLIAKYRPVIKKHISDMRAIHGEKGN